MKKLFRIAALVVFASVATIGCRSPEPTAPAKQAPEGAVTQISEDSLLTLTQERTFQYFWDGAEPHSGMARERFHMDGNYPQDDKHIVTTGGSGFGIMAIIVGMERNFITDRQGVDRLERIVKFLKEADRFHGVWPHWLNGETGEVKPFGTKDDGGDLVETSFLVQGLITARQYLRRDGGQEEVFIAAQMDTLWRQVEWDWYTRGGENVLYWHWSPNYDWEMDFPLEGYNETLITYVMAASSPTHTISADAYHEGWARNGNITADVTTYGYDLQLSHNGAPQYGGPLFWAHYSYLGLDPRGLEDRYADYWQENRNHTLINRQWAVENSHNYEGYGEDLWGLTASYSVNGYAAHRPGEEDLGVISPTAALSSFPYTPEYSMDVLQNFYYHLSDKILGPYGFYDAFSLEEDWFPQKYLAIDQGPIVVMIENHRTGLLWELFMSSPEVQKGLKKLDFQSPHLE
ncbi:glucoamylase family protein [Fodinibius sp.]|uniref:glucoamylase family protein n=1 Tax=Fodinibius sp. TaxID=1872440 RepID=UPI0035615D29